MDWQKIVFVAAFGLLFHLAKAQENYQEIFSEDYEEAIRYLKGEEKWMDDLIHSYGLKPKEVKAVVFPELIRYNAIQDKIETVALESLYIQYGKDYANFSVGRFQIKPSFAEKVEIDFLKAFDEMKAKTWSPQPKDTIQNQDNRSSRLERIGDQEGMVRYLCLFFKLMESKHPQWTSEEEKIKFFATAYNSDYRRSKEEINSFLPKKFFHTGMIPSKKYSYADISWFYFQH